MGGERDHRYWDALYSKHPGSWGIEDRVLDEETEDLAPGRALDLGCGTGANSLKLASKGWRVVGVDWFVVALKTARRAAEGQRGRVRFVAADITRWAGRVPFDLVVCLYSLPDGEGRRLLLENASSQLSPGAVLLVTDWHASMAARWSCGDGELTTPEEIASMLTGLAVEKAEVRKLQVLSPDVDPLARGEEFADVVLVRARKVSPDVGRGDPAACPEPPNA